MVAGRRILSLNINDATVLYAAYMPFIQHGALFIPGNETYQIGHEIFLLLGLPDEPEKIPVAGKVVWITPARAEGIRVRGIGVQFSDHDSAARSRIENALVGKLESEKRSYSL